VSGNAVVREMQASLATLNIEISKSTCWTHLRAALTNYGVAVSPQKPGGVLLPSHIEKKIAKIVRGLRARKFPVFASHVIRWTAEEIKDTEYAKYFVNGEPTEGWYRGWLRRMEFTTGVLRPLEQARKDWYIVENLVTYF
jgi:hypothetical protein